VTPLCPRRRSCHAYAARPSPSCACLQTQSNRAPTPARERHEIEGKEVVAVPFHDLFFLRLDRATQAQDRRKPHRRPGSVVPSGLASPVAVSQVQTRISPAFTLRSPGIRGCVVCQKRAHLCRPELGARCLLGQNRILGQCATRGCVSDVCMSRRVQNLFVPLGPSPQDVMCDFRFWTGNDETAPYVCCTCEQPPPLRPQRGESFTQIHNRARVPRRVLPVLFSENTHGVTALDRSSNGRKR
jgi:hypothetical protein